MITEEQGRQLALWFKYTPPACAKEAEKAESVTVASIHLARAIMEHGDTMKERAALTYVRQAWSTLMIRLVPGEGPLILR